MHEKNSHCSFCGAAAPPQPFPRTCPICRKTTYVNPVPVSVLLLPIDGGLVTIRRAIEPHRGLLALPGGFIDLGESWQHACVRELREETGISLEQERVHLFDVHSAPDGTLLVFGIAPELPLSALPAFVPNSETSELVLLRTPTTLAFPLHTRVAAAYFAGRR